MKFFFELEKKQIFKNLNTLKNNKFFINSLLVNDHKLIQIFLNQILSKNSKYFFIKIIFNFFLFFFQYIKFKNNYKNFNYFFEISSAISNNLYLNNPIFLFSWYLNYFFFLFQIKKKNNLKKLKNNNLNNYDLTFLKKSKRKIYFFKLLKSFFLLNKNKKLIFLFNDILFDCFLNLKSSFLYKNKLLIYKKFLTN